MTKVSRALLFKAQCIELDYTYTLLDNGLLDRLNIGGNPLVFNASSYLGKVRF